VGPLGPFVSRGIVYTTDTKDWNRLHEGESRVEGYRDPIVTRVIQVSCRRRPAGLAQAAPPPFGQAGRVGAGVRTAARGLLPVAGL